MKQKSMFIACITFAGTVLLISCSNNETSKSDSNSTPLNNTTEMKPATIADSMNNLHDSTAMKIREEQKEKEADEKEKDEKQD